MNPLLSIRGRLAVVLIAGLLLSVPVCLAASPQSPSDASYCPIEPGRYLVYRHGSDEKAADVIQTVIGMVPVEDGQAAESEHRREGKVLDYSYLAVREDGVFQHHKVYIGPMRGVRTTKATVCLLPFPVKPGTVREYEDVMMVQTSGGPMRSEDKARLRYKVRIEVQAIDDLVQVPAGRFLCARVVRTQTFHDGREHVTTSYWAPNVGLVKTGDSMELSAFGFTPMQNGETAERLLARALEADGVVDAKVNWCGADVVRDFRSRFALVEAHEQDPWLMRVFGSTTRRFDVDSQEDWQLLVADEGLDFGAGGAASLLPMKLAGAAAVLAGWQVSPGSVFTGYGRSTTRQLEQNQKQVEVSVQGGGSRLQGVVTTDGKTLTSVKVYRGR